MNETQIDWVAQLPASLQGLTSAGQSTSLVNAIALAEGRLPSRQSSYFLNSSQQIEGEPLLEDLLHADSLSVPAAMLDPRANESGNSDEPILGVVTFDPRALSPGLTRPTHWVDFSVVVRTGGQWVRVPMEAETLERLPDAPSNGAHDYALYLDCEANPEPGALLINASSRAKLVGCLQRGHWAVRFDGLGCFLACATDLDSH